jgi:carbonic anhydrase/acetyltransferase-like protein (isoleucine patch superfamily)
MVKTRIMPIYAIGPQRPVIHPSVFIADTAAVIGEVEMDEHSSIWFGATLRGDNTLIRIGARSNIQEGAVVHTDPGHQALIGEGVTVGHQAMLHGCIIGNGSLIGMQAVVLNGARIGENCLIGACALITSNMVIPPNSMVLGAPARVVRPVTDAQIASMQKAAEGYVRRSELFRQQLRRLDHA